MVWAIPFDLSGKELFDNNEFPKLLRREIKEVGVVITELSIHAGVKTILYLTPVETDKRIGILIISRNLGVETIRESIALAPSTKWPLFRESLIDR